MRLLPLTTTEQYQVLTSEAYDDSFDLYKTSLKLEIDMVNTHRYWHHKLKDILRLALLAVTFRQTEKVHTTHWSIAPSISMNHSVFTANFSSTKYLVFVIWDTIDFEKKNNIKSLCSLCFIWPNIYKVFLKFDSLSCSLV